MPVASAKTAHLPGFIAVGRIDALGDPAALSESSIGFFPTNTTPGDLQITQYLCNFDMHI